MSVIAAAPTSATTNCYLEREDPNAIIADLLALDIVAPEDMAKLHDYAVFHHHDGERPRGRPLTIIRNVEIYDLFQAASFHFGIRRWRHVSVSVKGALQIRIADQKAIGRVRGPGERSPAPLPDWYELNHIAYGHWEELGFDPAAPVFQLLPPPGAPYLNIAEALHLRQPA